jgi:tRNA(Arg) A34 adenosine deaminase TadA
MNKEFMKMAIDIAVENIKENNGGPFGAVIVKDGKIISKACNSVTKTNDPTAHAEINAIRKACQELNTFDLSGCEIYSSCEPCPMCLSAIYWAKIEKIYYSADRYDAANIGFNDSFIYNELSLPIKERTIPSENIMKQEGQEPFKLWQKNENKIEY